MMLSKKIFVVFLIVFSYNVNNLYAQDKPFEINDTILIRKSTSKRKLTRKIKNWMKEEKGMQVVATNKKERKIVGKGYFNYYNRVKIPGIYLSAHAHEKCKGAIVFAVHIQLYDTMIVVKYTNFTHEAAFSEYGQTSYGRLTEKSKAPAGVCMELEEWCTAVWEDMKTKSTIEITNRKARMIPSRLIRKRVIKSEGVSSDTTVVEKKEEKNLDYLKLDNYLIKEDPEIRRQEEKRKLEEQAAAEKAAKEAKEAAEKAAKKAEDGEEVEVQEKEAPEPEEEAETEEDTKPAKKKKKKGDYEEEE